MTLLTALNRVQRRLSLAVTTGIIADGQETQNLLLELAQMTLEDLTNRTEFDWPILKREQSFTASLASLQASGKASDFHRAIKGTFWNRSTDRQLSGPMSESEWALGFGEPITSTVQQYVQFRYDGMHIFPAPTVADTIAYSYIINTPILNGSTYKTTFTADADTSLFGDRLLVTGVRWRYLADKGRDYAEALKDDEIAIASEYARQCGAGRDLALAWPEPDELTHPIVPETGFTGAS